MSHPSDASGREPETAPPAGVSISRRRPRIIWVAIGVVLALTVAAITTALLTTHHRHAGEQFAAPPTSAETAAVMTVLGRHAQALLSRDEQQWDADLDQAPASDGYRAQQLAELRNLASVPITTWRYTLDSPVDSPDVLSAAASRLGARVVVLQVSLHYALSGVDPQPTAKSMWITAVERGGVFTLAGDSDAEASGGHTWHGPWDFGPIEVLQTPHTLVLAHPAHARDMATFSALVEQAVGVVTSVWGTDWNRDVAVLIPDSSAEFAAVSADGGNTTDIAAVSVADQVLPDGTVLGARIVLNPATLKELDAAGRRLVVQHELTHIAARAVTNDQMPTWVIEGFADYVGNLTSTLTVKQTAAELAAEVRRGVIPANLPTTADFAGGAPRLAQSYEEAWLACRLIAQRSSQPGLVRFYKAVSQNVSSGLDPTTAVDRALRSIADLDLTHFVALWRQDLKQLLG